MFLLAKYATATTITFPMVKRGVVDLAVSADWTPATNDTKISKDAGTFANATNNPVAVASGASWKLDLTTGDLTGGVIDIAIQDAATKVVEDQYIKIYTYGNASAKLPGIDYTDAVRLGLTSLPNVAAGGAGGLITGNANSSTLIQAMLDSIQVGTISTSVAAATATTFRCSDITEATASHFLGSQVRVISGNLAKQWLGVVTAYSLASSQGFFTVFPGSPAAEALGSGDKVVFI